MNFVAVAWAYLVLGLIVLSVIDWRRVLGVIATLFHMATWPISAVIEFATRYELNAHRFLGFATGRRRG